MILIAVQDIKASAFLNPITVRTTAEGIRQFESQVKNKESLFHAHPSDFILFALGEYNELTGEIKPYEQIRTLATATEFIQ